VRNIACMEKMRNACKIFVGKLGRKRPCRRPRRRWADNIRMNVRKIVWEDVVWIHVAEDKGQ